jgi:phage shock protein C
VDIDERCRAHRGANRHQGKDSTMPTIDIGLTRSTTNRWIFGVCGGIAEKFGMNALAVRLGLIVIAVVIPGISIFPTILLYIAAGLLLPEDTDAA